MSAIALRQASQQHSKPRRSPLRPGSARKRHGCPQSSDGSPTCDCFKLRAEGLSLAAIAKQTGKPYRQVADCIARSLAQELASPEGESKLAELRRLAEQEAANERARLEAESRARFDALMREVGLSPKLLAVRVKLLALADPSRNSNEHERANALTALAKVNAELASMQNLDWSVVGP